MLRVPQLLIPIIFFSSMAPAQSRVDCDAMHSRILNQTVRYCVALPPGYDAKDSSHAARRYSVLYFLHGLGEDEQTLLNTGGWNLIEDLQQQHRISDFLLVAPQGKQTFYINSADGSVRYNDFFLQEFIPHIESKYRVRAGRQNRAITGVSMGGYGALRFAFAHPELFSAVSAQAAALITQSPVQLDAAEQSGISLGKILQAVFGKPTDVAHWKANNPFLLARANESGVRSLAIYFNCGQQDDFGFEQGAETLHAQLEAEHVKHDYHLYPGDHSMQYFLAHFREVLEFHSRAFGEHK
jgi:S-formylglutathione hydrolase FrmB